jgi:hypothetical protein
MKTIRLPLPFTGEEAEAAVIKNTAFVCPSNVTERSITEAVVSVKKSNCVLRVYVSNVS